MSLIELWSRLIVKGKNHIFDYFCQFLPHGLPNNALIAMELCKLLELNMIHRIFGNRHFRIKFRYLRGSKGRISLVFENCFGNHEKTVPNFSSC